MVFKMKKSISFVKEIFDDIKNNFLEDIKIIEMENIPNEEYFKLEIQQWIKIKNIVCVYIDLASSTKINIEENQKLAAHIFNSYIKAVVKIFKEYQCKYIDIQGDGGFALFDGDNKVTKAVVSAVTIKTLLSRDTNYLSNFVSDKLKNTNLSLRVGIHQGSILAKKAGIRGENEIVWLGDVVSVASKICNLKFYENNQFKSDTIRITETIYQNLTNKHLTISCGCGGEAVDLWKKYIFEKPYFGLNNLYILTTNWCEKCGDDFSYNAINNTKREIQ